MTFDQWMMTLPGYARSGFNRSLARQCWEAAQKVPQEALEKIADPRKRHSEPDKYTELGCVMNIADVALRKMKGEFYE